MFSPNAAAYRWEHKVQAVDAFMYQLAIWEIEFEVGWLADWSLTRTKLDEGETAEDKFVWSSRMGCQAI